MALGHGCRLCGVLYDFLRLCSALCNRVATLPAVLAAHQAPIGRTPMVRGYNDLLDTHSSKIFFCQAPHGAM